MSEKSMTEAHVSASARVVRVSVRVLQAVEEELKTAALPPLSWYDLVLELLRAEPGGLRPTSCNPPCSFRNTTCRA
jgi:hypothetical protein